MTTYLAEKRLILCRQAKRPKFISNENIKRALTNRKFLDKLNWLLLNYLPFLQEITQFLQKLFLYTRTNTYSQNFFIHLHTHCLTTSQKRTIEIVKTYTQIHFLHYFLTLLTYR